MFTIATAERVVINYARRTDKQTLRLAQALRYLSDTGKSVRDLVALTADEAAPIGRNRIALLIRVVKGLPEDVTVEDFAVALKAATDANRGKPAAAEPVTADTSEGETTPAPKADTVPQGDATPSVADLTVDDAVRLLWEIVTAHGNDPKMQAALLDAAAFTAPVDLGHLVTAPATV